MILGREDVAEFAPRGVVHAPIRSRDRPSGEGGFAAFASEGERTVYILQAVLDAVTLDARASAPNETIGLLAGNVERDAEGEYLVVREREEASGREKQASPGSVRLSARGAAAVRRRLADRNPRLHLIGWYHSHPSFQAVYSGVDREEQATWGDRQVGLVVSGLIGAEPFGVYSGPQNTNLRRLAIPILRPDEPHFWPQIETHSPPPAACGAHESARPAPGRKILRRASVALLVAAVVATAIGVLLLTRRVAAVERVVEGLAERSGPLRVGAIGARSGPGRTKRSKPIGLRVR